MIQPALFYAQVESYEGLNRLKQKTMELRKSVRLIKASSVYKRKRATASGGEFFEVVIQVEGLESADQYFELAQRSQTELLAVRGELRLDPQLTLPNPKLLLDTFILHMAAECAPYWEHRVKQKTLSELDQLVKQEDPVEFLTQGEALIRF